MSYMISGLVIFLKLKQEDSVFPDHRAKHLMFPASRGSFLVFADRRKKTSAKNGYIEYAPWLSDWAIT